MKGGWVIGQRVEFQNGFTADVVAVDGEYAVLRESELVVVGERRFIVAHGGGGEFSFPWEGEGDYVDTLEIALADMARAKAGGYV